MNPRGRPLRAVLALALAGLVAASCGTVQGAPTPAPPRVALFEDLSVPDALDVALSAWLSTQAFVRAQTDAGLPAPLDVEAFDTRGDEASALSDARAIAADPTFVAVIVAPFWVEPVSVAQVWARANLPVLNLSTMGTRSGVWLSFVADLQQQSDAVASLATPQTGSGPLCLAGDGTPWSELVDRDVRLSAATSSIVALPSDPGDAADAARKRGCHAVVWTGFSPGAQDLRSDLPRNITIVGTDAMKTWPYLVGAPDRTTTVLTCSCADVNTSIGTPQKTFINRYQVATGLTPGIYAVEAWDVAGLLARGSREAPGGRASLATWLGALRGYRGVAGSYRFTASPPASIHDFRGVGSRWIGI